jgi:cholesterol transport system auxiliary component
MNYLAPTLHASPNRATPILSFAPAQHRTGACYLFWCGIAFASACLVGGCLSRPALVRQTFALHPESPAKGLGSNRQGVLAIRTVEVSPLFEGRSFVYRVGPDRYETDPYAEFMVPPNRALEIALRTCLRTSGLFQEVTESRSQLQADTSLEVHAQDLYGDFRNSSNPAAVLSMRFLFFEPSTGQPEKLLLQRDYSQRVPLASPTAAALAAGWDQALTRLISQAESDLVSARAKTLSRSP